MAPQLVLAPYKVRFKYSVSGNPHTLNAYCDAFGSADPSGWSIRGQNTPADTGFSFIDLATFTVMAPFYASATDAFQGAELYRRDGAAWIFEAGMTTAVAPTGSGGTGFAMGICISGKDGGNRRLPFYIYEGLFRLVEKENSYALLTANEKALVDNFYNVGLGAGSGSVWNWALSKDATQLPDRWLANVTDSNEKLRRLRHLK